MASQESWKMGEEGTGSRQSQVPDRPIHCLNNCGFFGSAATMNLCSKCYKELTLSSSSLLASKAPATEPAAANNIEAASITVAYSSKSMKIENKKPTTPIIEPASSSASSKSIKIEAEGGSCEESGGGRVRKSKETDVLEEEEEEPRRRNKNRCYSCNKRVGLTGFKCRCGDLFCAQHRYSDMHNCTFDYKTAGRLAIQMANPVVKAPKIHKI